MALAPSALTGVCGLDSPDATEDAAWRSLIARQAPPNVAR
jgi:hypothetical protein